MSQHPEFELLDEFVFGLLEPADMLRVHDHVRTCADCRAECDELRSVIDVLPYALPLPADLPALRNRILAATDLPRSSNRTINIIRALAAVLLLALAGDAFLASRLAQGSRIALAPPNPVPSPRRTDRPFASTPRPARRTSPPVAAAPRQIVDAQRAKKIAGLERDLALARVQIRGQRGRVRELETALALARATPRIVTVTVTPPAIPKATVAPMPSFTPPTEQEKLVAALRTGRVYAIDGAVDGEPWHLTVVQPRDGDHARIFSGTPSAPHGETYRTWVVRNGRTVDIGELPPGTPTTLEMPMALEVGDVIAFSREPIGTGELPTTPFLMQLKITL